MTPLSRLASSPKGDGTCGPVGLVPRWYSPSPRQLRGLWVWRATTVVEMRHLRACWRLLRLLGHIAKGLFIVALRFPTLSPEQQHARVQVWSLQLLARAGVSLRIQGQPPLTGPVMLVANHISWLDIPVMHAARHCRFVSKSDVQGWPLIGTLATAAGTLYIERSSRRDALRMVRSMQEALERGEVLAVFPEGTDR